MNLFGRGKKEEEEEHLIVRCRSDAAEELIKDVSKKLKQVDMDIDFKMTHLVTR